MMLDYENDIREGITTAIRHCTEANGKYMYDYNETKESSFIFSVDFNN